MDEILEFVALEATETEDGLKTVMTFTQAAIHLIKDTYGIDEEQLEEMISSTIDQNEEVWNELDDDETESLIQDLTDQVVCAKFAVEEMEIYDFSAMIYSCNDNGEVQIVVLTEEATGYI